jgi:hypothetical protein
MLCDHERQAFSDLLDEIGEQYGRAVSGGVKITWWRLLSDRLDLTTLRAALDRHLLDSERGRFFPQPSDVLARLEHAHGQRPTADEAWALALDTFDEAATVCVTDEILQAVSATTPVWNIGDKVGARMAFKAAYVRLVSEGRASGQTPTWQLSLGWDAQRRTLAAQEAVRSGRLTALQVRAHLPAPRAEGLPTLIAGALSDRNRVIALPLDADAVTRQRMRALREANAGRIAPVDETATPAATAAAAERQRFAQRKRQALDDLERLAAQTSVQESA